MTSKQKNELVALVEKWQGQVAKMRHADDNLKSMIDGELDALLDTITEDYRGDGDED